MKLDDKFPFLYKRDDSIHTPEKLKELQALPLADKIQITMARIMEFVNAAGGPEHVVVSYSGGKDSTVLLHICRQLYPGIKAVYSDTGLEYPEVRKMARDAGSDMVRPSMLFPEVITQYGYPLVSKEVSEAIYYARRIRNNDKTPDRKQAELEGNRRNGDWLNDVDLGDNRERYSLTGNIKVAPDEKKHTVAKREEPEGLRADKKPNETDRCRCNLTGTDYEFD